MISNQDARTEGIKSPAQLSIEYAVYLLGYTAAVQIGEWLVYLERYCSISLFGYLVNLKDSPPVLRNHWYRIFYLKKFTKRELLENFCIFICGFI